MPHPIRPGESLAQELAIAEEKAGLEIAQLPARLASPVGDQPKQPTL
jgi:hypothetical protein